MLGKALNYILQTYSQGDSSNYHFIFEFTLIALLLALVFVPKKRSRVAPETFTEAEIQAYVKEWTPEPLAATHDVENRKRRSEDDLHTSRPVIDGIPATHCSVNGNTVINFGSGNYLGFLGRREIISDALQAADEHGIGSCGPRGFYGTFDKHIELEDRISKFLKTEATITYSYGFATVASAIPSYAKVGDIVFCDEAVSFSAQRGLQVSKSKVIWFKHNDMDDLAEKLQQQEAIDLKNPQRAVKARKFILVEGLYYNTGNICPLPKIVELKHKHRCRIFLDETSSFGTLGQTGRGVTEHFNVAVEDIDMICASIESSMASIGGFCSGSDYVIDHQRLSGSGYVFSASLPPLLAKATTTAIDLLDSESSMLLSKLRTNIKLFHMLFTQKIQHAAHQQSMRLLQTKGTDKTFSPVIHLYVSNSQLSYREKAIYLESLCKKTLDTMSILLVRAKYLDDKEHMSLEPSLRVSISSGHTAEDIELLVDALATATTTIA